MISATYGSEVAPQRRALFRDHVSHLDRRRSPGAASLRTPAPGLGTSRLLRKCPGADPVELLAGLFFAAGVAIGPDNAAYITNRSTSPTAGEVLLLPLTPCP